MSQQIKQVKEKIIVIDMESKQTNFHLLLSSILSHISIETKYTNECTSASVHTNK